MSMWLIGNTWNMENSKKADVEISNGNNKQTKQEGKEKKHLLLW